MPSAIFRFGTAAPFRIVCAKHAGKLTETSGRTTRAISSSRSCAATNSPDGEDDGPFDAAVIGGGVVGLGCLRALTLAGFRTVTLEAEDALAAGAASAGNTGIACTAADCAAGSLERAR